MAMRGWPENERPRERLYFNGPTALADAELLALQLGSGTRGKDAVEVAREVLAAYGSLAEVAGCEVTELARLPGVGRAKAARLVSAFELTRRLRARTPGVRTALGSPAEVYAAFGPLMEDLKREVFRVALLDAQNGLLRDVVISEGTLSGQRGQFPAPRVRAGRAREPPRRGSAVRERAIDRRRLRSVGAVRGGE
jgi:DNA repair protein RadC